MATRVSAKSILKQTTPASKPTLSDEEKAKVERDRRNIGIALHHANRIQHQKNVQNQILSNIEVLLDYPPSQSVIPEEESNFASLIQPFQPSDFDSLIEERCIDGRCGYALCPNSPRSKTMGSNAAWKLKGKGAEDYCSNDCLRKALYVKAQLSEVPAWEREPGQEPQIVLEDSSRSASIRQTASRLREQSEGKEELAMERGETTASLRPGQVMADNVVEKATVTPKSSSNAKFKPSSHTAIEGYEPTLNLNGDIDSNDFEHYSTEALLAGEKDPEPVAPAIDNDEQEAWRDLFDNIDKR